MSAERAAGRPVNPVVVLACAVLLPGTGHLVLGLSQRALTFLFFMAILGWVSLRLAPADASFLARHGGAVLIYGFSVIDAYRISRFRFENWRHMRDASPT